MRPMPVSALSPYRHSLAAGLTAVLLATPLAGRAQSSGTTLTLRQVLDSVMATHPSIGAAQAGLRAARGSRLSAGAFANPMLAYQVENAPLPNRAPPPMDREVMLTAMLPLEPIYQRGARVREADAMSRAAQADLSDTQQRVALEAAGAFYRAAIAQVAADVMTDQVRWLDSVVAYNRVRVEEGVTAEADLLRSQIERDRVRAQGALRDVELARARATLQSVLGTAGRWSAFGRVAVDSLPLPLSLTSAPATDSGRSLAMLDLDVERSPALAGALARRPALRGARERLLAAGSGLSAARTMILREVGAMFGTKRTEGATSLVFGVSLPLPLFDQNRGALLRAAAERDVAAFDVAIMERQVRADLQAAYASAIILTGRLSILAEGDSTVAGGAVATSFGVLIRAAEARRLALAAYQEGAMPLLQVLDAAQAAGEARLAFFELLFAQHESVLSLIVAEGRDPVAAISATSPPESAGRALPHSSNR